MSSRRLGLLPKRRALITLRLAKLYAEPESFQSLKKKKNDTARSNIKTEGLSQGGDVSKLQEVGEQQVAMDTILNLTGVFEGLASMRIASVKNQVLESQAFFSEIWHIYKQLRVDRLFRFGRTDRDD